MFHHHRFGHFIGSRPTSLLPPAQIGCTPPTGAPHRHRPLPEPSWESQKISSVIPEIWAFINTEGGRVAAARLKVSMAFRMPMLSPPPWPGVSTSSSPPMPTTSPVFPRDPYGQTATPSSCHRSVTIVTPRETIAHARTLCGETLIACRPSLLTEAPHIKRRVSNVLAHHAKSL
jgi:hypothetical protein